MRARLALSALAAVLLLSGCDLFSSEDSVSGYWEGVSEFTVDSVLADHNVRVTADYSMTFEFDLVHNDGLVDAGTIIARREGTLIFREAGYDPDTLQYSGEIVIQPYELRGTFIEPELEVDPIDEFAPYEADMWTFEVSGSSAETSDFIDNVWTFYPQEGDSFEFEIRSDETFVMKRKDRPEAYNAGGSETQGLRWRADLREVASD